MLNNLKLIRVIICFLLVSTLFHCIDSPVPPPAVTILDLPDNVYKSSVIAIEGLFTLAVFQKSQHSYINRRLNQNEENFRFGLDSLYPFFDVRQINNHSETNSLITPKKALIKALSIQPKVIDFLSYSRFPDVVEAGLSFNQVETAQAESVFLVHQEYRYQDQQDTAIHIDFIKKYLTSKGDSFQFKDFSEVLLLGSDTILKREIIRADPSGETWFHYPVLPENSAIKVWEITRHKVYSTKDSLLKKLASENSFYSNTLDTLIRFKQVNTVTGSVIEIRAKKEIQDSKNIFYPAQSAHDIYLRHSNLDFLREVVVKVNTHLLDSAQNAFNLRWLREYLVIEGDTVILSTSNAYDSTRILQQDLDYDRNSRKLSVRLNEVDSLYLSPKS